MLDLFTLMLVTISYLDIKRSSSISLRIKMSNRSCIIDLDPTSLLRIAIMKRQFPASFVLRRREPKPHQMTSRSRWSMIFVCCPGMEDMLIR